MAIAPIRRTRATTVVSTTSGATVRQQLSTRSQQPLSAVRLTADQVGNPEQLARALSDMQSAQVQSLNAQRSDPMTAGSVYFRAVAVVGGTAKLFTHNLGRPFVGYLVTRIVGSNQVTVREVALPAGLSISQAVNLMPSATGTIDVKVF